MNKFIIISTSVSKEERVAETGHDEKLNLLQATCIVASELSKKFKPDSPWDVPGIERAMRDAHDSGNDPVDIVAAMMKAAADPSCKTPKGFLMPKYWPTESPQAAVKPLRCPEHPSYYAHNCGGCRADKLETRLEQPIGYSSVPHTTRTPTPCPPHLRKQLGLKPKAET